MTNPPQDPREQSAGVDSAFPDDDVQLYGQQMARMRKAEEAPLEVAQFAIMDYSTPVNMYLNTDGDWTTRPDDAVIFNDFNVARLVARSLPIRSLRVETRATFRTPMPV